VKAGILLGRAGEDGIAIVLTPSATPDAPLTYPRLQKRIVRECWPDRIYDDAR
jgi:hypothetical protein